MTAELAAAGINFNQYSILHLAAREPRAIGELVRELGMDRTTLTATSGSRPQRAGSSSFRALTCASAASP